MTASNPTAKRPMLVNIVSVSYSGSTWVNLMLGSHSEAFSVGELTSIRRHDRPICKLHGESCPVWSRFAVDGAANLVDRIEAVAPRRWLIVNNPRQMQGELDASGRPQRFIHLVRDGRAVAASQLRKFPNTSMWRAARHWARSVKKNEARLRGRPAGSVITVKYEDLVADTESNLRRICGHLAMDYEPAMLAYWTRDHCFLGGSRGTLYSLAKKREADLPAPHVRKHADAKFDAAFYDKADPERFVDERWKSELSDWQMWWFNLAAGRVNRRLGYER